MDRLEQMPQDWTRALAVAAHPDDVEYAVAGAVAAWTTAGKDVRYTIVTRGEAGIDTIPPEQCGPLREAEQRTAAALVGVSQVEFLDHRDGVIEYGLRLRRDIAAAIRRHRPELVLVGNLHDTWLGGGWNTPDHRHVGRATLDAIGDAANRWIFPEIAEQLPPWTGVRYAAVGGSPQPTHAVDITDTMERAVASLQAHRAYLQALGGQMASPRRFLEQMADLVAPRFGGRRAAAFELRRM
ncbi:PIG-L deacetylase family protein [Catellatospora tritici]|uniref:PIG-L deacetylase family protein n=1 Tax=Catellatospora tritici TaxID=2851566 RepID=UPI001C2CC6AA|nr:PIG-L deacetylase family protein [Catellatospora tritici]MBV1856443.1 PIG-L family deacetylase [Catellatospora tritici]